MPSLRLALRQFARQRAFTVTAVLVLAIGMGANVAVFSLVHTFHFTPLPVRDPDQLVAVLVPETGNLFTEEGYRVLGGHTNALSEFAAFARASLIVRRGDQPSRQSIEYVTPNYFEFLGIHAAMGRSLSVADRNTPHLVISDRWWAGAFQRDPDVIGQGVEIQGTMFTIIGVAPPGFAGAVPVQPAEGWISHELRNDLGMSGDLSYGQRWLNVLGRLRPGISLDAATASLRAIEDEVLEPWMIEQHRHIELVPCGRGMMPPEQRREGKVVSLLTSAVLALVLATAAANLAGLLMSRGVSRRREFAIQLALGATRARVARQLLMESLLLALAGGGLGLMLSNWGVRGFLLLIPRMAGVEVHIPLSGYVLAFTLVLSLLAALLFGFAPALQSARTSVNAALKDDTRGLTRRSRWNEARNILVLSQVAVCVVLLIATGLVWRSLHNRRAFETGFDSRNVMVATLWERDQRMDRDAFADQLAGLRDAIDDLPGVQSASLVTHAPMGLAVGSARVSGDLSAPREWHTATINSVSPGFFDTLRVPLLAGRDFMDRDRRVSEPVVIVSRRLAEALYPGETALGQQVHYAGKPHEIIGVVGDVRYMRFESSQFAGTLYLSAGQHPYVSSPNLLVRAGQPDEAVEAAVMSMVRRADPGRQRPFVQSYEQYMDEILARERSTTWLLGLAGFTGLALSCLGLYGVMSYHVAQRTREIGLRMALGALRGQVMLLILRRGLFLTGLGTLIGCGLAMGTSRFVRHLLYGVGPADPLTYAGVVVALGIVAGLACWLPARRAANVDPMEALRSE